MTEPMPVRKTLGDRIGLLILKALLLTCLLLFAWACWGFVLDEVHDRNPERVKQVARQRMQEAWGQAYELHLEDRDDCTLTGTAINKAEGEDLKLTVRFSKNEVHCIGVAPSGRTTSFDGSWGEPSFFDAHPRYMYRMHFLAFCGAVLGTVYPLMRYVGWRKPFSAWLERLLFLCLPVNACVALLQAYLIVTKSGIL